MDAAHRYTSILRCALKIAYPFAFDRCPCHRCRSAANRTISERFFLHVCHYFCNPLENAVFQFRRIDSACRTFVTIGYTVVAIEKPMDIVRMREKCRSMGWAVRPFALRTTWISIRRIDRLQINVPNQQHTKHTRKRKIHLVQGCLWGEFS